MVEVRVVFLKIGEIDTQKEKYTADVFLQAKWKEPRLDGQSDIVSIMKSHAGEVGILCHLLITNYE